MKTVIVCNSAEPWLGHGATHFGFKNIPDFDPMYCYTPADVSKWAETLGTFVRSMEEDYFLLMLDDYWVQEVDAYLLEDAEQAMQSGEVAKVDVSGDRLQFPHDTWDAGFVRSFEDAPYRTSLQAAIWSRDYLLNFCHEGWTPWDFEIEGSKMAKLMGGDIIGTAPPQSATSTCYAEGSGMASLTFEDICQKLADNEQFSFARWGDGEWLCAMGAEGRNCDGHEYARDLSLSLRAVLLDGQKYFMGMQPFAIDRHGKEIASWLKDHDIQTDWCDADVLHDASIAGRLTEFANALRGRQVVLIGPRHLAKVAHSLQAHHIICAERNVWRWYRQIYGDLLDQLDSTTVVLYCMSMPTEVMMHQVYKEYGDSITQIDCGSVFDPYCGVVSRRYHNDIARKLEGQDG